MTSVMIFVIKHWRWLAGAAVLAFAGLMVHAYGRSRYNAGAATVQAKWDAASAQHQINVEQSLANAMAAANQASHKEVGNKRDYTGRWSKFTKPRA